MKALEWKQGEDPDYAETRGGRSPETNKVAYTGFPKGTQQYPNPGPLQPALTVGIFSHGGGLLGPSTHCGSEIA